MHLHYSATTKKTHIHTKRSSIQLDTTNTKHPTHNIHKHTKFVENTNHPHPQTQHTHHIHKISLDKIKIYLTHKTLLSYTKATHNQAHANLQISIKKQRWAKVLPTLNAFIPIHA